MKTMILAAGQGTRLLPYTLKRPKPLFPVLNRPLLLLTVRRLRKAGFGEIIVNCHHLRRQIVDALQAEKGCRPQEEDIVLGTGGGLRKAMDSLGREPALIVNGDIYHTIDYQAVYHGHRQSGADVTLVLHDYPRFNNVAVNDRLMVEDFRLSDASGREASELLAFTGIHVINPEVLGIMPPDTPACIIDCYEQLLSRGGKIRAHVAKGHYWTDMGTPGDYLRLHGGLITGKIPVYEELAEELSEAPFAGKQKAAIGENVTLQDWACLGKGTVIGPGATIQKSVIWDGAAVPPGSIIKNAIITD